MTEEQATKVMDAADGTRTAYVKVIKIGEAKTAAARGAGLADRPVTRRGALPGL